MAIKRESGGSKKPIEKRLMPKAAKLMGAPRSAREPKKALGISAAKKMGSPADTNLKVYKKLKDKSYTKAETTRLNKQSKPKPPSMPAGKPTTKAKAVATANKSRGAEIKPSRGSKTAKQMGDMNMRENYNASRDVKKPTLSGQPGPRSKQLSSYKKDGGAGRRFTRAGGKGK